MDPLTIGLLGGAGLGILKGMTVDKDKEAKDRKYAAAVARYSPWTGMAIPQVQSADPLGNAMQFGLAGGMLGQGVSQVNAQNDLMAAQKSALEANPQAVYQPGQGMAPYATSAQPSGYSPWMYVNR